MSLQRVPGPVCPSREPCIDGGTLCRDRSWPPTPVGSQPSLWDRVRNTFDHAARRVTGEGKSVLLRMLDLLPFKQDSPYSTALLRHYVEGTGDPYRLEKIPETWQEWIVKQTRARPGTYKDLSPYDVGIYDLQNSLGHFDVVVTRQSPKVRVYRIHDVYQFGFKPQDRKQQGRHGFPLGDLDPDTMRALRWLLPGTRYCNPGGFEEGWEIKRLGKETILFIPQQFLEEQGKPFEVTGEFTR